MDVLIVDDHPIVREILEARARAIFDGATIHTARSLAEALQRARSVKRLDLVLFDLGLPDFSGVEALTRFRKTVPGVPVLVVSASEDRPTVLAALKAGARGYVAKTSSPEVIRAAMRLVAAGEKFIPPRRWGATSTP